MKTTIYPKPLEGKISSPSSRSHTHISLICASLAKEPSILINPLICDDTLKTINALEQLGVTFKRDDDKLKVTPPKQFKYVSNKIICGDSGTTLHFLVPLLTFLQDGVTFECSNSLVNRVLDEDFEHFSFNFIKTQNTLTFSKLSILTNLELNSEHTSQAIAGYLLSAPLFNDETSLLINSKYIDPYLNTTLDIMAKFGVDYEIFEENDSYKINIKNQNYKGTTYQIEGDYSTASNFLIMGLFNKSIEVLNLPKLTLQNEISILDIIRLINGKLIIKNKSITTIKSELSNIKIDIKGINELIPLIITLCTIIPGENILYNITSLPHNTIERTENIIKILNKLGANIKLNNNDLIIMGQDFLHGGIELDSQNDHRIIFAITSISSLIKDPITINNSEAIDKSYPEFWNVFRQLGGEFAHKENTIE